MTRQEIAHGGEGIRASEDDLIFSDEDAHDRNAEKRTWKILIVDDDKDVHQVTRLALSDFSFQGRALMLLSAHDSDEAKALLAQHTDFALILLDVVMEREDA